MEAIALIVALLLMFYLPALVFDWLKNKFGGPK
jgi:hypothetical protein